MVFNPTDMSATGYPPEANGASMRKNVAHRAAGGLKKRKRDRPTALHVPDPLKALTKPDDGTLVFYPTSNDDVSELLRFASSNDMTVSVLNNQYTGVQGDSKGGDLVICLSHETFTGVSVDLDSMTCAIGGGVTSRMLDTELSKHDMVTPTVGYTVGLGAFLSGGFGFASRMLGLSADSVLEAELVLSDGKLITTNEKQYSDLFWALKGCGTSFACVTKLKMKCYPLRRSLSANIIYPFNIETTPALLRHWRDSLVDAPRELYSNFVLAAGPKAPHGAIAIIQISHLGSHDTGMPIIQQLTAFADEKYLLKDIDEISYLRQQELVEGILKGTVVSKSPQPEALVQYLLDGDAVMDISDEIIDTTCSRFADNAQAGSIWCFELFGGSVQDVTDGCIPLSVRSAKFHAASILRIPIDDPTPMQKDQAGREWIRDIISKVSPGGPLPSFFPTRRDDPREAKRFHDVIRGSYGHENWSKLKHIKRKYDPENRFSLGFDNGMLGYEEVLIDGA